MHGRYVVRLTPADVGRRVTVRHRLDQPDRSATTTDVVGLLEAWADGVLRVRRRDGTVAQVQEHHVVAAKVIA